MVRRLIKRSLIFLSVIMTFYYLSQGVTGIFLPNYFLQIGLSVNQIILLTASIFLTLGLLPILFIKVFHKSFENLLTIGIVFNLIFFFLLMVVSDPFVLGLVQGIAFAAFWPAFNLLLYRFTNIKRRGIVVTFLYVALPILTSIIGPVLGGAFIYFLGFNSVFILGIIFLTIAFLFSLKIKYSPVTEKFAIPKSYLLLLFGLIIVVYGFSEVGWIAWPLFLRSLTQGYLEMGVLASILSIIFAGVSLLAGKFSEAEKHRVRFVFFGLLMGSIWLVLVSFVQTTQQLIGVSVFSGLSGAFTMLLFSLYGDFFKRKHHAVLVVLWEVFLMFGRLGNLIPTYLFINNFNFHNYFLTIGLLSLSSVALFSIFGFLYFKGRIAPDINQK